MPNRISATLSAGDSASLLAKLDEIRALLPFLEGLSNDERRSLPKLGDKSLAFVRRCLELTRQDDSFLPRNFSTADFAADLALYETLAPVIGGIEQLHELLVDTQTLVGSEAYLAALEVYHHAKRGGRNQGLDELLDRVSQRFTQRRVPAEPSPA